MPPAYAVTASITMPDGQTLTSTATVGGETRADDAADMARAALRAAFQALDVQAAGWQPVPAQHRADVPTRQPLYPGSGVPTELLPRIPAART